MLKFAKFAGLAAWWAMMRACGWRHIRAWIQAGCDYKKALQLFRMLPCSQGISRPDRFLKEWAWRISKACSLHDKQRSGRPRKLDKDTVDRAVQLFLAGSTQDGNQTGFSDLKEALSSSPELQSIVSTHDMQPQTLLLNMQEANPNLVKRREDLKPMLTNRLKQQRVTACNKLLQYSDAWFRRVFWLDAKTMHIAPTARQVWVDSSVPMPVKKDTRMPRSGRDRRTLHFYSMVNWCVGPVAIMFVTGTSGLQHAQPYVVSQLASK